MEYVGLVFGLGMLFVIREFWRGNERVEKAWLPFWGSRSEIAIRAWLHAGPLVSFIIFVISVGTALDLLLYGNDQSPLTMVGIAITLVAMPLVVTIFVSNKPRFLAAPHLRHEKGAIAMREEKRSLRG